jgi:hypothetical protein
MKKRVTTWVRVPSRVKLKDPEKAVALKAVEHFLAVHVRPKIPPPPQDNPHHFNYVISTEARWHRGFLYIYLRYASPHPDAFTPEFEEAQVRFEPMALQRFNLAYKRHTGQFWTMASDLSLNDALEMLESMPQFLLIF